MSAKYDGKMPPELDIDEGNDEPGPEPDLAQPEDDPKPLKKHQFLLLPEDPPEDDE